MKISIIIPALNEEELIEQALGSSNGAPDLEQIVVDGGSLDRTVELARTLGARVLTAPACRATQMNAGAGAASGEILLFLHADTRLPKGFDEVVRQIAERPQFAAGAFRLHIDDPAIALRIIETGANWRARLLQLPYGDQAIFLRRDLFHRLGGYREIPILEDFDLIRRARRHGRIHIAPLPVSTSARRYRQRGAWRSFLSNQAAISAYCLGASPNGIARWYHRARP